MSRAGPAPAGQRQNTGCPALSRHAALLLILAISTSAADLSERLTELSATAPSGGHGIHVVQLESGNVLFGQNEARLFMPASNLKLVTAAFALERLGPGYTFATRVFREASGNLILVGSGDPSLSGRIFPYRKDSRTGPPLAAIEELADHIVAAGITKIDGDIIGDDRLFIWEPFPPSWTQDDAVNDFGAPVSALSLNENFVAVNASAGAAPGDPIELTLSPGLEYLTLDNRAVTLARGAHARLRADRIPGTRQWRITGTVAMGRRAAQLELPVDDPALFAATALYDALVQRGVAIDGQPQARHRMLGDSYAPLTGEELAVHQSPPLKDLLQMMNKVSHNLYAELLTREAARPARPDGTADAAAADMADYLASIGIASEDWKLDDGSGLSRNALLTPRLLTSLLVRMATGEHRELWMGLLPTGGEDGTLENRLCCMRGGRGIRAKTGSLNRAQTLSGYAGSKTHGLLAFSIMLNDFSVSESAARAWVDKIATALLE